jgi:hypothetical protein
VSEETVDAVRDAFQRSPRKSSRRASHGSQRKSTRRASHGSPRKSTRRASHGSPRKSTRRASHELLIPQSTVVNILRKRLRLCAYEVQLAQALEPDDHPRRANSATEILQRIDEASDCLRCVCSSDEAAFHTSGKLNRHDIRIWGLENPRVVLESERNRPKVNVWCALMHNKVTGHDGALCCTSDRRVSATGSFPTGWCTASLGVTCASVLGCNVSKPMDWEGRSNTMVTTFTGHYPSGPFDGGMLRTKCIRHQFQTLTL